MASSHITSTRVGGKSDVGVVNQLTTKHDEGSTGNITGIRLFMVYCLVCQVFSIYWAYEVYQRFYSWGYLNRKDKVLLAWGVVSAVAMVVFTSAYSVLEYQRREKKKR